MLSIFLPLFTFYAVRPSTMWSRCEEEAEEGDDPPPGKGWGFTPPPTCLGPYSLPPDPKGRAGGTVLCRLRCCEGFYRLAQPKGPTDEHAPRRGAIRLVAESPPPRAGAGWGWACGDPPQWERGVSGRGFFLVCVLHYRGGRVGQGLSGFLGGWVSNRPPLSPCRVMSNLC